MLPDVSPNVTINESAPSTVVELWGDELAYNRKYVTHRTLTPTCRYSLKVHSRLRHSSCKIRTINLSLSLSLSDCIGVLLVLQTLVAPICISSAGNLITKILRNFGGYKTFRPRLTKYCRGMRPGIPSGVDACAIYRPQTFKDAL